MRGRNDRRASRPATGHGICHLLRRRPAERNLLRHHRRIHLLPARRINHTDSGPTGAFVVVVAGIVAKYGLDGLFTCTLIAGIILIMMGITGLGAAVQ